MFTPEAVIDQIQNTKKQMISTFVIDKKFAEPMVEFVDAQTEYTKAAAQSAKKIGEDFVKLTQDMAKEIASGDLIKGMNDKATQKFYETFWAQAFKNYNGMFQTKNA